MNELATRLSIRGRGPATAFSRIVRVLAWQRVTPRCLLLETGVGEEFFVVVEVHCDAWRLRRLCEHWKKIVGVAEVTTHGAGAVVRPISSDDPSSSV